MSQTIEAFNCNVTRQYSHLFSEGHEISGEAAAHEIPFATMVLDRSGTVRYCHADAARLFRSNAHTLGGHHVREVIPNLPFNPRTPGYNVAYATFWASEGPQRRFCGVDGQGGLFGLQVALDKLELQKRHQIIVSLAATGCTCSGAGTARRCSGTGFDVRAHGTEIPAFAD